MISEHRVELHASIEQWLIRSLELVQKVLGPMSAIDVVPKHEHKIESNLLPV